MCILVQECHQLYTQLLEEAQGRRQWGHNFWKLNELRLSTHRDQTGIISVLFSLLILPQCFVKSQNDLERRSITYSAKQKKTKRGQEDIKTFKVLQYDLREGAKKRSGCKAKARGANKVDKVCGGCIWKQNRNTPHSNCSNKCSIISTVHKVWWRTEMMPCLKQKT